MLNRVLTICFTAIALMASLLSFPSHAWASGASGAQLFQSNCAACHALGTNRIIAMKNLKKEALETYDMYSKEKIVYQVTNGKNAMPAFRGRLKPDQIDAVADYVLEQAELGWPR